MKPRQEAASLVPGEIMTVPQVAEYLHTCTETIYRVVKKGKIPALRVGRDLRFRRSELEAWMAQQQRETDRAVAEEPVPVTAPKRVKRRPRKRAKKAK